MGPRAALIALGMHECDGYVSVKSNVPFGKAAHLCEEAADATDFALPGGKPYSWCLAERMMGRSIEGE